VPVQVDVGFGDAVEPELGMYPTLLELPAPCLRLYPREAVIAEKLHAMIVLGLLNGRLKDYYDIWFLSMCNRFDAARVAQAIANTFTRRDTTLPKDIPDAFSAAFAHVPGKTQMWSGFVRKSALAEDTPALEAVITAVVNFAWPLMQKMAANDRPSGIWTPETGWTFTP